MWVGPCGTQTRNRGDVVASQAIVRRIRESPGALFQQEPSGEKYDDRRGQRWSMTAVSERASQSVTSFTVLLAPGIHFLEIVDELG